MDGGSNHQNSRYLGPTLALVFLALIAFTLLAAILFLATPAFQAQAEDSGVEPNQALASASVDFPDVSIVSPDGAPRGRQLDRPIE